MTEKKAVAILDIAAPPTGLDRLNWRTQERRRHCGSEDILAGAGGGPIGKILEIKENTIHPGGRSINMIPAEPKLRL